MTNIDLLQAEADNLMKMDKISDDDTPHEYPALGGAISIPLVSLDREENFILDISRGRLDLIKGTYQNRSRQIIVLVRLDFGGQPHRNPDGAEITSPHLHVYREGYGDKWAFELPPDKFHNTSDLWLTLEEFMDYCNIVVRPNITRTLFT